MLVQTRSYVLILRMPLDKRPHLRFVILPIVYVPEWNIVLCICTYISVASMMLGPLFLVAHNFPGVKFRSNNADDEDISFMASQVESACNWGGWIGIQLTGGLSCEYIFYTYFPSLYGIVYINICNMNKFI